MTTSQAVGRIWIAWVKAYLYAKQEKRSVVLCGVDTTKRGQLDFIWE